jgi:hypothetical protein
MFPGRWADSAGCALGRVGLVQWAEEFRCWRVLPNAITIRTCHPSRVKEFPGRWADSASCALGQGGLVQ